MLRTVRSDNENLDHRRISQLGWVTGEDGEGIFTPGYSEARNAEDVLKRRIVLSKPEERIKICRAEGLIRHSDWTPVPLSLLGERLAAAAAKGPHYQLAPEYSLFGDRVCRELGIPAVTFWAHDYYGSQYQGFTPEHAALQPEFGKVITLDGVELVVVETNGSWQIHIDGGLGVVRCPTNAQHPIEGMVVVPAECIDVNA